MLLAACPGPPPGEGAMMLLVRGGGKGRAELRGARVVIESPGVGAALVRAPGAAWPVTAGDRPGAVGAGKGGGVWTWALGLDWLPAGGRPSGGLGVCAQVWTQSSMRATTKVLTNPLRLKVSV